MKTFSALLRREWLQHRFGWAMLAIAPLAVAMLVVSAGKVDFRPELDARMGPLLPTMLTVGSLVFAVVVTTAILWITSLMLTSGLARRDHGDRSVEFWLSMPTGHSASLGVPLFVHLILVPMAAIGIGLLSGLLVSLVLVARLATMGDWLSMPWGVIVQAVAAMALQASAGIVLATLWLLPLILLMVLSTAYFKRWGLVVLPVALALGNFAVDRMTGHPVILNFLTQIFENASSALFAANSEHVSVEGPGDLMAMLTNAPGRAWTELARALRAVISPLMAAATLISAASFALLVHWRQRGA